MSGLAIALRLDGGPIETERAERMLVPLRYRAYDAQGVWSGEAIALGHLAWHTTPESRRERQPVHDERGRLVLIMDGRVDNRAELTAKLRAAGVHPRDDTDAELTLCAFRQWGEDCAAKIIGDFAFAVWDRERRRLYCARDILGLRPFYYFSDGKILLCGTSLAQILAAPEVARRPNEGLAGEYLLGRITSHGETLFQGVMELPPRHCLTVAEGKIATRVYYDLLPRAEAHYTDDRECAEQLLAVLREAVRCRLRSHTGLWAELSGGLDSSSVTALAATMLREQSGGGNELRAVSMVFPGRNCDEQPYIEQVLAWLGLEARMVEPGRPQLAPYLTQARRHLDFPGYPNFAPDAFAGAAAATRARVVLTGQGGDEWLTGSPFHEADLLRHLRLPSLVRQIADDSRAFRDTFQERFDWSVIRNYCLAPLVPMAWRRTLKRCLRRRTLPEWMMPGFAERNALRERIERPSSGLRFPSFVQESMHWDFVRAQRCHELAVDGRVKADLGWELRHPLMDRRLIEFAAALPETQRWRGAVTKVAIRNATAGLLPQDVRKRSLKVHFNDIFSEAALAMIARVPPRELAAAGWIEPVAVERMAARCRDLFVRGDANHNRYNDSLWMIFGLELWLRAAFRPESLPQV